MLLIWKIHSYIYLINLEIESNTVVLHLLKPILLTL